MSGDTIEQQWTDFAAAIFEGKEISRVQYVETRRAFFGGAAAMFFVMQFISGEAKTEDEGAAKIDVAFKEIEQYLMNLSSMEYDQSDRL